MCINTASTIVGLKHKQKKVNFTCGKCFECVNKKRRDLAFRMHWHAKGSKFCWFTLLTYNDENLPWLNTVTGEIQSHTNLYGKLHEWVQYPHKDHLRKFFKRLRKFQHDYEKRQSLDHLKISYVAVAEYGEKDGRLHYHLVLYDVRPYVMERVNNGQIWNKGFVYNKVNKSGEDYRDAYYISKYLFKQQLMYEKGDPRKPFKIQSNGLGDYFLEKCKPLIYGNALLHMDEDNGILMGIPYYYKERIPEIKKLKINYMQFEKMKKLSDKAIKEYNEKKDRKGDPYYLDQYKKRNIKQDLFIKEIRNGKKQIQPIAR